MFSSKNERLNEMVKDTCNGTGEIGTFDGKTWTVFSRWFAMTPAEAGAVQRYLSSGRDCQIVAGAYRFDNDGQCHEVYFNVLRGGVLLSVYVY